MRKSAQYTELITMLQSPLETSKSCCAACTAPVQPLNQHCVGMALQQSEHRSQAPSVPKVESTLYARDTAAASAFSSPLPLPPMPTPALRGVSGLQEATHGDDLKHILQLLIHKKSCLSKSTRRQTKHALRVVAQLTPGDPTATVTIRFACSQQPPAALCTSEELTTSGALALPLSPISSLTDLTRVRTTPSSFSPTSAPPPSDTTDRLPFAITKSQLPLSRVRKRSQFCSFRRPSGAVADTRPLLNARTTTPSTTPLRRYCNLAPRRSALGPQCGPQRGRNVRGSVICMKGCWKMGLSRGRGLHDEVSHEGTAARSRRVARRW